MNEAASAALHIQGPTLRWAEVVYRESSPEVRRCWQHRFDFDVLTVLKGGEPGAEGLDQMGDLVDETFAKTEVSDLRVVLHPADVFSFFTPVSADLAEADRMRQVIQQAALVTGTRSPDDLRITPHSIRTDVVDGQAVEWIHVLAVPRDVNARIERLVDRLSMESHVLTVSTQAAAWLLGMIETHHPAGRDVEARPYSLAVGQYGSYTEYTLRNATAWYHSHATEETRTANQPYYAIGFLNQIGVSTGELGGVHLYGSDVDPEAYDLFEDIMDSEVEPLDPSRVPSLAREDFGDEVVEAYGPCLGAAVGAGQEE